jgi:hypothetical protein
MLYVPAAIGFNFNPTILTTATISTPQIISETTAKNKPIGWLAGGI